MKKIIILSILSSFIFADQDTIPLGKKTTPQSSEDSVVAKKKKVIKKEKAGEVPPEPYVASISIFGTDKLNETSLRKFLGKDLDDWLDKGLKGDPDSLSMEEQLANKVKNKFGFHDVSWSVVQFFEPGDLAIHITLDVVEKTDVKSRLDFLPEPTEELADPDKLISQWAEYEGMALDLVQNGELAPQTEQCVAFHCPFGHKHEKLKKYEKIFVDGVKKHADALANILQKDKRPEFRAASAYLLPYLKDGNRVVNLMVSRIKDPNPLVRNNVLRVLGDISEFHPQFVVPVKAVIEALNFPKASDRAKAIYVVYLQALNSKNSREEIKKTAVPYLLSLLAGKQPDSKEFAHGTLRKISGKDYSAKDITSWNNWYQKLAKDK